MANSADTISTLSGNLKVKYAPAIIKVVPMVCLLQQYRPDETSQPVLPAIKVKWSDVASNGQSFQVPIKTKSGHGVSFNGSAGAVSTLQDALNMEVVQASVVGFEVMNRQLVAFSAAYAGSEAGPKAMEPTAKLVLEDLKDILYTQNEMSALWGQYTTTGYGVIESQTLVSTTLTVIFTADSFAAGWWPREIGARYEFFTGTTFSPSGQQGSAYATVASVDIANRTVVFTTTGSGWNDVTVPAAGYTCFPKGALTTGGTYNEQIGLIKQLTARTGTIFGLARETYALLQGNSIAVGGRLTKAKVTAGAMLPINMGNLLDMVLIVSTPTWSDLAAEDLTQKIFDSSYSGAVSKSGSRQLSYEVLNKNVRVVCHPYMQGGKAILTSEDHLSWIGSTDVTFKLPQGDDLFYIYQDTNAYIAQCISIKQIFHEAPGKAAVFTGIVNVSS